MPKYVCSCCGSNKFFKIDPFADERKRERDIGGKSTCRRGLFNYQYSQSIKTGIKIEITTLIDAYICQKCGHVDFNAKALVDKIKKDEKYFKDKIKSLKAELKVAVERLKTFKKESELTFEEFEKTYNKENNSEPISLRYDYNSRIKGIKTEISYLSLRIIQIDKEINDYTSYLEVVSEIKFK